MNKPIRYSLAMTAIACSLAGCGGGSAGVSNTGLLHSLTAGSMAVSYVSPAVITPTVSVIGLNATVTAMAGANFTNLVFAPVPTLGQTQIAFDNQGQVWISNAAGTTPVDRTHFPNPWDPTKPTSNPTFSQDGRLAFSQYDPVSKHYQIYVMPRFAMNFTYTKLSDGTADDLNPLWSPDNTRIVFQRKTLLLPKSQIYVMNNDGTNVKKIDDGTTDDTYPTWSPTSTKIVFQRHVLATGRYRLFVENPDGTLPLALGSLLLPGSDMTQPSWSPDGTQIAFLLKTGVGNTIAYSMDPGGNTMKQLTFETGNVTSPRFSPDSTRIVYAKAMVAPATAIATANADGTAAATLIDLKSTVGSPVWSPFYASRSFIGTSGAFGTAASGFLFGQSDTSYSSLLTFTAKTPTSATVTPQTPSSPGNAAFVFLIRADLITGMQYSISYYAAPTNIIPGQTGSDTQALVTFDANGFLRFVIPAVAKGGVKPAALKSASGNLVYTGSFRAIFDAQGKDISNGGASTVEIDPRNGKLVRFAR